MKLIPLDILLYEKGQLCLSLKKSLTASVFERESGTSLISVKPVLVVACGNVSFYEIRRDAMTGEESRDEMARLKGEG